MMLRYLLGISIDQQHGLPLFFNQDSSKFLNNGRDSFLVPATDKLNNVVLRVRKKAG